MKIGTKLVCEFDQIHKAGQSPSNQRLSITTIMSTLIGIVNPTQQ